jgi:hypothetical protein
MEGIGHRWKITAHGDWRAQGGDFRTFPGQFVVAAGQLGFPVGSILLGSTDTNGY